LAGLSEGWWVEFAGWKLERRGNRVNLLGEVVRF
jgi:hypothetical protein